MNIITQDSSISQNLQPSLRVYKSQTKNIKFEELKNEIQESQKIWQL